LRRLRANNLFSRKSRGNFVLQHSRRFFWCCFPPRFVVSPNCSRKTFFLKLGGLVAAAGVRPKMFAPFRSAPSLAAADSPPVALRPEPRAVARREGSL